MTIKISSIKTNPKIVNTDVNTSAPLKSIKSVPKTEPTETDTKPQDASVEAEELEAEKSTETETKPVCGDILASALGLKRAPQPGSRASATPEHDEESLKEGYPSTVVKDEYGSEDQDEDMNEILKGRSDSIQRLTSSQAISKTLVSGNGRPSNTMKSGTTAPPKGMQFVSGNMRPKLGAPRITNNNNNPRFIMKDVHGRPINKLQRPNMKAAG